jgi:hypothetical protein
LVQAFNGNREGQAGNGVADYSQRMSGHSVRYEGSQAGAWIERLMDEI